MITIEYFGIDVGKGKSFIAHYSNNDFVKEFELIHNEKGFNSLLSYINNYSGIYFLFEATGIYSKVIELFCKDNHVPYYMINPLEAKFLTTTLRTWKTDKSDAHKLALLAKDLNKKPSRNFSENIYIKVRELTRWYEELNDQQSYLKNSIVQILDMTFPEIQSLFKSRYSKFALQIVKKFPHPSYVHHFDKVSLIEIIGECTDKKISMNKKVKYADMLLNFARESYPALPEDSFYIDKLICIIDDLLSFMKRQEEIKEKLMKLSTELDEFRVLVSIPGIGDLTAMLIIGELGDIKSFPSHKKLNAYIGIDIKRYQSGKTQYKDKINKRGNRRARALFYIVVMNIIRGKRHYSNHIVDYYYKLRRQPNDKGHKTAVIACVNKLLKTIQYLVVNNKEYNYLMSPH